MQNTQIFFRAVLFFKDFLASFFDGENRFNFVVMLRDYMGIVRQRLSKSDESAYKFTAKMDIGNSPKILLVVHEFSRTGVPYAVLYLARAIFKIYGVRPVVISPKDGPVREEFDGDGFITVVDPLLFKYRRYVVEPYRFVESFDRVVVTSIASFYFISQFRGIAKRLTWWIHETEQGFTLAEKVGADISALFASCESIWLGSPLSFAPALRCTSKQKLHSLFYGCCDEKIANNVKKNKKIVFSVFGSIEYRKGQDIFLDAIQCLPAELKEKAIFRIVGSSISNIYSNKYYKNILKMANQLNCVEYIDSVPMSELMNLYAETDVFVSVSRDDAMPIVVSHGLMLSKICLCSSAIGHAALLKNQENAIIFTNESYNELSEQMALILTDIDRYKKIGNNGRVVYEKHFSSSSFIERLKNLMCNVN